MIGKKHIPLWLLLACVAGIVTVLMASIASWWLFTRQTDAEIVFGEPVTLRNHSPFPWFSTAYVSIRSAVANETFCIAQKPPPRLRCNGTEWQLDQGCANGTSLSSGLRLEISPALDTIVIYRRIPCPWIETRAFAQWSIEPVATRVIGAACVVTVVLFSLVFLVRHCCRCDWRHRPGSLYEAVPLHGRQKAPQACSVQEDEPQLRLEDEEVDEFECRRIKKEGDATELMSVL
jgi:hypothetical protein